MVPVSSSTGNTSVQSETVKFNDSNSGQSVIFNSVSDSSFRANYQPGRDIGQSGFFQRPVLIYSYQWVQGTPYSASFSPWELLMQDDRIQRKLENYSWFRGRIHLKILINGTQFLYGMAIASYQPLPTFCPTTIINTSTYDDDLIPLSQRPHVFLYPGVNQGGELILPFFYYRDWLDITSDSDVTAMGTLTLREYVPLKNANGVSTDAVTVQVYAWFEEVELAGPTVKSTLQAGDEYVYNGVVSAPASAVSRALGILGAVPGIGAFATASSKAVGKVAEISAWFGFSDTPVIENVMPFKNLPFHSFASGEISAPIEKLTIDPKNELTVDPRVVGLDGTDPMSIQNFIGRKSFLDIQTWGATAAPNALLFAMRVTPNLAKLETTGGATYRQATPMGHMNHLFQYWRGGIIVEVKVIKSSFHRGRYRVSYDPNGDIINNTNAATSTSAIYTQIVDISDNPVMEFHVPYLQSAPWCNCSTSMTQVNFGGGGFAYSHNTLDDNGYFTIRCLTEQTSPVASADIFLAISVRAADDFKFAGPKDPSKLWSPYLLQAGKWEEEPEPEVPIFDIETGEGPIPFKITKQSIVNVEHEKTRYCDDCRDCFIYPTRRNTFIEWVSDDACRFCETLSYNINVVLAREYARNNSQNERITYSHLQAGDVVSYDHPPLVSIADFIPVECKQEFLVNMGECILSIRQLLRRTCLSRVQQINSDITDLIMLLRFGFQRQPLIYGFDTAGINAATSAITPATSKAFNYAYNVPYNWLSQCFVGYRGSHNWSIDIDSPVPIGFVRVNRKLGTTPAVEYKAYSTQGTTLTSSTIPYFFMGVTECGATGQSVTHQLTQTGVTIQSPMYSQFRMLSTSASYRTAGTAIDGSYIDSLVLEANLKPSIVTTATLPNYNPVHTQVYYFHSIGTDFTFLFFLNVPTLVSTALPVPLD